MAYMKKLAYYASVGVASGIILGLYDVFIVK